MRTSDKLSADEKVKLLETYQDNLDALAEKILRQLEVAKDVMPVQ